MQLFNAAYEFMPPIFNLFFYEPFYDLERLFDEVFNGPRSVGGELERRTHPSDNARGWRPRMDLHEDLKKNLVTATFELPGIKKDDVKVEIHDGRLVISGESSVSSESEKDENGYAVQERRFGKFSRVLQLPRGVRDNEVKAAMDNGVLTVTFPRTAPEAAPKKITISSRL